MINPIYLSLVFHNHQPVGNFDFVNEHGYQVAYLPLVEALEKHPRIHTGLHFTGSLLDWLVRHRPELLERIKALTAQGQVEILTGGYYEPILATLQDVDKLGQIRKLSDAVRQWFDTEPQGIWLAERVWEPQLAKPLAEAGGRYIIVDDTHFEGVGFNKDKDLFGYFITEEQGYPLAVFPTLTYLRYAIPWRTVQVVIDWLREQATDGLRSLQPKLAFMGDDGEKFGVWPGTYKHCWENGYMEDLFSAIEANGDWLKTTTPSAYLEQYPAIGRAYLPTASYMEMGEWALPPGPSNELAGIRHDLEAEHNDTLLRYLRGGMWRNFMVKYDEINHMHKRGLHISRAVHAMLEGPAKEEALDRLWAAQSNDAYWHGVFGGIYLFHFRVANYANLIAAEVLAEGENAPLSIAKYDLDMDSFEELVLTGSLYAMVWDLARGGALREWDYRPASYNLLNLMTRRDEGYHQDLLAAVAENRVVVVGESSSGQLENIHSETVRVKEPNLQHCLIADWYRRGAFIDHFLREDANLEGFYRSAYPEQGDFVILPYEAQWQIDGEQASVHLSRDGHVWVGEHHLPVRVSKVFVVTQGSTQLEVRYTVRNTAQQALDARFAVETALAFDGGDNTDYCALELGDERQSLADIKAHEDVAAYAATTDIRKLRTRTTLSAPATLWRYPLETVTLSEAGFERGYQGTVFLQWWHLRLDPGEEWKVTMTLETESLD